jgi:N-acetylneuraminic acid mutarotase
MKKYLLTPLLLSITLLITVKSQSYSITWEKSDNFPVRLSEIKAITCNDKIYVIGGKITKDNTDLTDNEDVDYTYEYNTKNKKWSKKSNMPTKRYDVALAIVNNLIYAISTENEVYDPKTDTWQILKPLEGGMAHLETVVFNNKIYVFGSNEGEYNKTMMYDPQANKWIEKASIPTPRLAPSVAIIENKIYVLGGIGFNENGQLGKLLQTIEVYDPQTDQWETKKPMPKSLWGAEGVIVKDNNLFLINIRSTEQHPEYNIYVYYPQSENWVAIDSTIPKRYSEQGVTLLDNKIYVIGGHDDTFTQYGDLYIGTIEKLDQ